VAQSHAPPVHPLSHWLPHPPQLLESLSVSVQELPQHWGLTPSLQELPQDPQLPLSLSSSTQPLLQHAGLTPSLQLLSHSPQLFES